MIAAPEVCKDERWLRKDDWGIPKCEGTADFRTSRNGLGISEEVPDIYKNLGNLIEGGNPFESMYDSLASIDSGRAPHSRAISSYLSLDIVGKSQYDYFVEERFVKCTNPIDSLTRRNKMPFSTRIPSSIPK